MTTIIEYSKPKATYLSVLADGKFHQNVEEGTEGAKRRDYETSDGKKGVKWEFLAESIKGKITNVALIEGDYGKLLQIFFIGEGDKEIIVSLGTQSSFGEDIMKKLPNIDLEKDVKLVPYSFTDENNKKRKGITVYQDDTKIADYYHEKKNEKFVSVNGYPEVPKESKDWDSEDWKLYFGLARKFLVEEVKKCKLYNVKPVEAGIEYPEEKVNLDDVPF